MPFFRPKNMIQIHATCIFKRCVSKKRMRWYMQKNSGSIGPKLVFSLFDDVKLPEKFTCDIKCIRKCLVFCTFMVVFWHIYVEKSHFGDPYDLEVICINYSICLVETLLLSTHMTICCIMIFWTKMWFNWLNLKIFSIITLISW